MDYTEIKSSFRKNKIGLVGLGILASLVIASVITAVTIPVETYKNWNNPASWTELPKSAQPIWVNWFLAKKIPEHQILYSPQTILKQSGSDSIAEQRFHVNYSYDYFPGEFLLNYNTKYSDSPVLQITVIRPDGMSIQLLSSSLPYSQQEVDYSDKVFSTNEIIKKNLRLQSGQFSYSLDNLGAKEIIFADKNSHQVLKGDYEFVVSIYGAKTMDSKLILGGKVYGLSGTDELRRDITIGLLWGTPVALFIGVIVALGSVISGLVFGVYAGYKGGRTDESMMRLNDIVYALPALPFLIILSVTTSNSIFLMIGFLMIFGWVGIAKVSRSMALQIKTRQFVDAAKTMGQKDSKIIFKHIIPQIMPYALASIAISVPAAITTEAGLSFLGLGDPTYPTWGQILHDAKSHGAAARGLWWWILPPGVMIAITGLAFVFIGNSLESTVNPKLRR
ncbi:MAG: ABC transporter permease [Nitrosopumilaceae archaeon]|nr:ABC transporter permease [Nitrosopumilaceae archaeon]